MSHAGWGTKRHARVNECGHPDARHYAKGLCRACYRRTPEFAAMRHAYYVANKAQFDAHAARYRASGGRQAKLYGLSREDYRRMVEAQGGLCAICGGPPGKKGLGVDHCHESGRIRSLLCASCNLGIGCLGDDAERLRRAAAYLDRHHSLRAEAASAVAP